MNKSKHIGRNHFRTEITIDVSNVQVNEDRYSFFYSVWINSDFDPISGIYEDTHSHKTEETRDEFKKLLQDSFGHQLVMQNILEKNLWNS